MDSHEPIAILIAEDNQDHCELMQNSLVQSELDCTVDTVASGIDCFDRVAAGGYDIVILDYRIPRMDGLAVLAEMRRMNLDVSVIMVTGMGDERIAVEALKSGAYDYIVKSDDFFAELVHTVKQSVEHRRLRTDQERLLARLRHSEQRYRTLFEDSPLSLWEEDFSDVKKYIDSLRASGVSDFESYFETHPDSVGRCVSLVKIVDVNKATLALYKAATPEDLRSGLQHVMVPDSYEAVKQQLAAIAEGHTSFACETQNRTLAGEPICVRLHWTTAPPGDTGYGKVLVSVVDITQMRALERERANLISMFAHDIKSALVVIESFVQRMRKKLDSLERYRQENYLDIIQKEAEKLEFMVSDFMEFSMLRTGALRYQFSSVSLESLLRDVLESYQPRAGQCGVTIRLERSSALPDIEADGERLRRVFTNIIDNALKFSPDNGTVSIELESRGDAVRIAIRDQGEGIPPSDLKKIFDPFHCSGPHGQHGHGLGLATVKAIVDGHSGAVHAESHPGAGTTFFVTLPCSQ